MSGRIKSFVLQGTTPNAAGQAKVGAPIGGLEEYDNFTVHAELLGATGGTLDVYVQRRLNTGEWQDWIHFPQLAGSAAAIKYAASQQMAATAPVVVGETADDGTTGAPALAANTVAPGHPGDQVRLLAVAGVGTSAGAAIRVTISAVRRGW